MNQPNFKDDPKLINEEHERHRARFAGVPYNPKQNAAMRAWARFRRWHHKLLQGDVKYET